MSGGFLRNLPIFFFEMLLVLPFTPFTLALNEEVLLPAVALLLLLCEGGEGLEWLKFFFIFGCQFLDGLLKGDKSSA